MPFVVVVVAVAVGAGFKPARIFARIIYPYYSPALFARIIYPHYLT